MTLGQAISVGKSLVSYYIEHGFTLEYVDKETATERLAICRSNGCEKFNRFTAKCTACGCIMPFKTKLKYDPVETGGDEELKETVCPLGLW